MWSKINEKEALQTHDKHIMHIQVCAKLPHHPEKSEQLSEIWAGKEHQVWRIVQLGCKIGALK